MSIWGDSSKTTHYCHTKWCIQFLFNNEVWTNPIFSEKKSKWLTFSDFYFYMGKMPASKHNSKTIHYRYTKSHTHILLHNELWTNPIFSKKKIQNGRLLTIFNDFYMEKCPASRHNSKTVHYRYTKSHTHIPLPGELWTDLIFSEKKSKMADL